MGGGPNIRVHQFGGPRPRMRPRNPGQQEPESPLRDMLIQLLPLIVLILFPIFSNLISAILFEPYPSSSSTSSYSSSGGNGASHQHQKQSPYQRQHAATQANMPKAPKMVFETADPERGFTEQRTMPRLGVGYYMQEKDVAAMTSKNLYEMDKHAEVAFLNQLQANCREEQARKKKLAEEAQGWFYQDPDKMELAVRYETPSCAIYENHVQKLYAIGS